VSPKGSKEDINVVASPPTGTVTFLFTDIEGSTKLWEEDPEAMQASLARHDEILRDATEQHGGYVFKTVGDAFCAAFPTAPDALEAAISAQRVLHAGGQDDESQLRVRMALHTGAAEERGGDYFGPTLNRVARLLSAGHGGQVLLSLPTQELVRDQLPAKTSLRDLGEHRLKDLFRPERVFQLLSPRLPVEFPPLRTLDAYRNNLPLQPTPLIGREKEVAEVCERLSRPEVRLLTLTGAGGTGKTRLGLQAAAELTDEFEDGVFFVSLAAISDPQLVVGSVAGTLGVKEAGGQPLLKSIEDYLGEKRILLVVDNFEQVLEAAPMVTELLSDAPNLKVLTTSRTHLRLYGEHEYGVPPLALPDPQRPPSVETLTHYEAVRLFVERAQSARADFSVTSDDARAVAEICVRLDGLPLAIELAAARIKVLPPQKLLDRLSDRLKLLTGGARDLPERQRTLRSTIEWSHGLLDQGEKVLFARLSVFAGGRTLEAIEAVCDAEGDLPVDVLDGIASLVDKSLLREEEGVGGEPRFVMLETIHEFARGKLQESGEAEVIKRLHAGFFFALAEQAEPELRGIRQEEWMERLEAEHDNLRAALRWSLGGGDAELGLRLAGALSYFWYARGHFSEARGWLEEALAKTAETLTDARARAFRELGTLAVGQGDYELAEASCGEALALYRELKDKKGVSLSCVDLGWAATYQGDYERATALFEEGLVAARESKDAWTLSHALNALSVMASHRGNFERAEALREEGLAVARKLGDERRVTAIRHNMALAELAQGNFERAQALWEENLVLDKHSQDTLGVALSCVHLGIVATRRGELERATKLLQEGLVLMEELGIKAGIAQTLESMAGLAGALGETQRAARLWGAADALREAVGVPWLPLERKIHLPYLDAIRSRSEEAVWVEAWEKGRAMTPEEAVSYALEGEVASA
jgi:predicted ATPase/class 3 adenylate cyclase